MTIASAWPEPAEILLFYDMSIEAMQSLEIALYRGAISVDSKFFGMTKPEMELALSEMRNELDRQVSLALLASCEAVLRVDFLDCVNRRKKGPAGVVSRFKELRKTYEDRVPLEEILDAWKSHVAHPAAFAAFTEYLRVRHWLAHGRYWSLKTARRAEPPDVVHVIRALFKLLPDFPTI